MNLRPLTMADADFLLELKNYSETRKFAIASHDEIKKEDHYKWLENNIQYFQVIENYGVSLGVIRIKNNEISIWINKKIWGKRVASDILKEISERGMTAKIVNGNIGSFKAFVRAGFKPIDYKENYYILKK